MSSVRNVNLLALEIVEMIERDFHLFDEKIPDFVNHLPSLFLSINDQNPLSIVGTYLPFEGDVPTYDFQLNIVAKKNHYKNLFSNTYIH